MLFVSLGRIRLKKAVGELFKVWLLHSKSLAFSIYDTERFESCHHGLWRCRRYCRNGTT